MNLLQILTTLFSNPDTRKLFLNLLAEILNGNFSIENFLQNINLEKALSLLSPLFQNSSNNDVKGQTMALSPIVNIADKDIVYSLNKYLENAK